MKGVKELKRRLKSVRNIKKITKAMEMVAATKLRRLQDRALATRPFASSIESMMKRVAEHADRSSSPLLKNPARAETEAIVIVGADKGLCGSYNSNLFRAAVNHLRGLKTQNVAPKLFIFGKRAQGFFGKMRDVSIERAWPDPVEKIEYRTVRRVLGELVKGFEDGTWQRVCIIYTSMKSIVSFKATVQQLLPIVTAPGVAARAQDGKDASGGKAPKAVEALVPYIMEPSPARILERLLPRYLEMQLYAAILESLASEFASRRIAMKSATDNADEMTQHLAMEYNKARQSGITAELLEIIGGAEALATSG